VTINLINRFGAMGPELTLSVIGLGYVGLPLALALAKTYPVIGYDQNTNRIAELRRGHDRTGEIASGYLVDSEICFTDNVTGLREADIFIVAVPTPVDASNQPELSALKLATESVGGVLRKGAVVVFESTVYPGVTEDICGPILERVSGLKCGSDFHIGYSPERINPGDSVHTVDRIVKVVAGQTQEVAETLAKIYGCMNDDQIFIAKDIKTAEAAKVIENAQRDINIAFMNEIAQIFHRLDISIYDVLETANTKWNFLPFTPGLVGGHCIGVDPYYLAHVAKAVGFEPKVILSGRSTNDAMAPYLADAISAELEAGSKILILGLTFKEDVPDLRNSKVGEIIRLLLEYGHTIQVHDPLADPDEAGQLYGIQLVEGFGSDFDCVMGCVAHKQYDDFSFDGVLRNGGLIADLKGIWRRSKNRDQYRYWSL
jgi:UDP-N-acetyl-D-galactosamine dehydrogenase